MPGSQQEAIRERLQEYEDRLDQLISQKANYDAEAAKLGTEQAALKRKAFEVTGPERAQLQKEARAIGFERDEWEVKAGEVGNEIAEVERACRPLREKLQGFKRKAARPALERLLEEEREEFRADMARRAGLIAVATGISPSMALDPLTMARVLTKGVILTELVEDAQEEAELLKQRLRLT